MSFLQIEHSQGPRGLGQLPIVGGLLELVGAVAGPLVGGARAEAELQAQQAQELRETQARVQRLQARRAQGRAGWPWLLLGAAAGAGGYLLWRRR